MSKNILVTGGAGYIGTHTCIEMLKCGYTPIVLDNFMNSCPEALNRVEKISGSKIKFYEGDMRDHAILKKIFAENKIEAVIHFAGLKAVGESVRKPLEYYENNINGTLVLLDEMRAANVKKIIFSSSATVYGDPERLPLTEDCHLSTTNPYGTTKLYLEGIMTDLYKSDNSWNIILLRYFNPIGAHESGLIGENPNGIPNNLTPYIAQVAGGKLKEINIFGNDYSTPDGTGVRDYIHVVDLSLGHVAALNKINTTGVHIYNLGTGIGYSVLDVIHAFEKACGKTLPYKICARRDGDIAACYADSTKAKNDLDWTAKLNMDDMCASLWNWQSKNPNGYSK